jgi:hypothetical protein
MSESKLTSIFCASCGREGDARTHRWIGLDGWHTYIHTYIHTSTTSRNESSCHEGIISIRELSVPSPLSDPPVVARTEQASRRADVLVPLPPQGSGQEATANAYWESHSQGGVPDGTALEGREEVRMSPPVRPCPFVASQSQVLLHMACPKPSCYLLLGC